MNKAKITQADALALQRVREEELALAERELELSQADRAQRRQRSPTLQQRLREFRNRHRMRIEAVGPRRAEEARELAATRRVFSGQVVGYDSSTKTATVQLPGGETIRGRTLGRGAPVGKVVVTIPLGSAIATIQSPEPRC